ncbi:DUF7673 family protein [Ralstonia nicotianae]|nr:hypothetical protein RPSD_52080 [Ralstonia solanacearum]
MTHPPPTITDTERAALESLLRSPSRDPERAAWWNPARCGSFAPSAAWELEDEMVGTLAVVYALAVRSRAFPDAFGYGEAFGQLIAQWRLELVCSVVPASAPTATMPE